MKKLIITEKPSVARDIAKVLGVSGRRDGYIEGKEYLITWAVGHLITLFEPNDYDESFKKWNYNTLPIIPKEIKIKPYTKTVKQLNVIKSLCDREDVTSLVCATDSGREGELIFRYIYSYIECEKPFERLWISSMTDESIKKGFEKLVDGKEYNRLYLAAKCRSESDWLVGINATRAYTTLNNTLLSVGRVQTPTLALIVNRHLEINDFKPKDYFEITAEYEEGFSGTWFKEQISETKIDTIEEANEIVNRVTGKEGIVTKVDKANKSQKAPLLYDLTELQRDGNKIYGFTATQVLEYAQDLYEKRKLITYPRTDSRYISDDMKKTVADTMYAINVPPYNKAINQLLKDGKLDIKFSNRIINNKKITDHHAIIPSIKNPSTVRMTEEEKKIYQLIVKRFIAVFYPDFKFNTTKLTAVVEGENFISKGKIVKELGWKKLYQKASDKDDQLLPDMKKNDPITIKEAKHTAKKTSAPKPYNEASLLSAMENAGRFVEEEELKEQLKDGGFGTPATRAGIIERLISVKYIFRKGKSIHPTDKGIKLIKIVPERLKSPEMTGRWEGGLTRISRDDLPVEQFMTSIHKFVNYIVKSAEKTKSMVEFEQENRGNNTYKIKGKVYGKCPVCGEGQVTVNTKAYYCSKFVEGCKFTLWKNALEPYSTLTEELVEKLLVNEKIEDYRFKQPQTGEEKTATLVLQKDGRCKLNNIKLVKREEAVKTEE